MEWWEVQRFIAGIRRRERTAWTTTRWLSWTVLRALGSKADTPEDMMQLPWEIERVDPEEDAENMKKLMEEMREFNRKQRHNDNN